MSACFTPFLMLSSRISAATSLTAIIASLIVTSAHAQFDPQEFLDKVLAGRNSIPGQYIVTLNDNAQAATSFTAQHHIAPLKVYSFALKGFAANLSPSAVAALKNDPAVEAVEPDYQVTAFGSPSQPLPTGINRAEADLSPTAKINGVDERVNVDIAVIDTGIDLRHADLNVYRSVNMIMPFFSGNDDNGHGTHVAGTTAAKDNGIGVVGMAPGARLWAVKVLDRNGAGSISTVIAGIDYVTSHASEIDVANMSLGCECQSAALDAAISRSVAAGVVYAVAAGNSAKDASTFSPANHSDVITVSAVADFNGQPGGGASPTCRTDVDDTFADFSNFGAPVDIAAPGVCITSTWKGGKYNTISGTSMASPHVAGAAALYIATHGKPTDAAGVEAVKAGLIAAATPQADLAGFTSDPDAFPEPLLNVGGF